MNRTSAKPWTTQQDYQTERDGEAMQRPVGGGKFVVEVYGYPRRLTFEAGPCQCGDTTDGVLFEFEGEGCWVVPLNELRRLVALAETQRSSSEPASQMNPRATPNRSSE